VTEPPEEFWDGLPVNRWRFSKFYLNSLFDGHLHLVRRGGDFPEHWANAEVAKRLRNAAWWRRTGIRISPCPQGLWVQSEDDKLGLEGDPQLREALAKALTEIAQLKEELWKLKNPS
jgi:hypothetical protein